MFPYYTREHTEKTKGFLVCLVYIKWKRWPETGQKYKRNLGQNIEKPPQRQLKKTFFSLTLLFVSCFLRRLIEVFVNCLTCHFELL